MAKRNVASLAGWIALSVLTGVIGALATSRAGDFYRTLDRPAWAPPSWLFSPVWTTLSVLMGIAAWRVWKAPPAQGGADARKLGLTLYVVQLVLNALWSWIFFAWRQGAAAFVEIIVLALFIIATMMAFARVRRAAALLLLPYLGWVLFATMLT
jgi:tryptophan-rich sensory protein